MKFRIGTRRSTLALAQANWVAEGLRHEGHEVELVEIVTSGDRGIAASGAKAGLKGLFVAEIVRTLQEGEVDVAVHSAKDLPSRDPEGVVLAAVPVRAEPHDVLVTRQRELPPGSRVGSSSLRRRGLFARFRPGFDLVDLRGNVDTRLRKVADGSVDGAILAAAGLARLGITPKNGEALPLEEMVPAPGQGALAVQTRTGDEHLVAGLDHAPSHVAYRAERRVMEMLGGGCALPLGAYARVDDHGVVELHAVLVEPDGTNLIEAGARSGSPIDAALETVAELMAGGAAGLIAKLGESSP